MKFDGLLMAAARYKPVDHSSITFKDVAGAEEAKAELQEIVDILRNPARYRDLGARIPRGMLLVGRPGTGKTLLARAVAGEAGVPFLKMSGSEFVEMFVGLGASRVRSLFDQARTSAPAIVFIDEIDAVGRRRGAGLGPVNDEREQTLNQLLVEMDGFDDWHTIIMLAATNRPDVLDPALLRPGRFDRQVIVGLADRRGREETLRIHAQPLRLAPQVDLAIVARATSGFSGADLANLCNEAALAAARHNHTWVTPDDFQEAFDKVLLGGPHSILLDPRQRRVFAYHEAGHTLAAWLTPGADPVRMVTIIPHRKAMGVTAQVPREDRYNYSREYLLGRLVVALGGRAAVELAVGELTTAAEHDLVGATQLARQMITRWGMSDLGVMAWRTSDPANAAPYEIALRDYSEKMASQIDQGVQELLRERYRIVRALLTRARRQLDRVAEALLDKETMSQEELAQILGPRPE